MKFSIIIPTWNNFSYLSMCIESVIKNTDNFECIICNNGSTDGTINFAHSLIDSDKRFHLVNLDRNYGFSVAVNRGLSLAIGEYLIILNDDTLVTPVWADHLVDSIAIAENRFGVSPIGIVGPASNNAGGSQFVEPGNYDLSSLDQFARDFFNQHQSEVSISGFISGFCMLITRACFEKVHYFDPDFGVGGWEDNDYCLRALLQGFKLAIDYRTFVHHFGQISLHRLGDSYVSTFHKNQASFYAKHQSTKHQKLFSITRIHNGSEYLPEFLSSTSKFVDGMIFLLDRCTDDSLELVSAHPKTARVLSFDGPFDEYRDRMQLLSTAIDCSADWILSLDVDEIFEPSFTYEFAHSLLSPCNPEILGYIFRFITFWTGRTHYRSDGVFGSMIGLRLFRALPFSLLTSFGHKGLHCPHAPLLGNSNMRMINKKILHFGYDTPEKCYNKYQSYTIQDPNPDLSRTGPEGYGHLISSTFSLTRYVETNTLSLCMIVRNEALSLFRFLSTYYCYFDEIVIVDTGSSDNTLSVARAFGARTFTFKWTRDFSAARNFAKKQCTGKWIFVLDPDEELEPQQFKTIYDHLDSDFDAFIFKFLNYLPSGEIALSDNVRLMRNIPEVYYSYFVHENISQAARKHHLKVTFSPVTIRHYGYLKPEKTKSLKTDSYYKMLRNQIKVFDKEPITFFHLAFHYFHENKDQLGFETLSHCLDLDSSFFLAHKELGIKYLEKSLYHFRKLSTLIPNTHYFYRWSQNIVQSLENAFNLKVL
jgi:glycosyltransferase involved in cell wall biosynthesis